MNEQIKTTTVDQLPEATSLDGLYVFGYASKNAVGKRSVKAPITLLKGNKGDTGAAGKDGKDGEVTAAQLKDALTSNENLASKEANGLMSIEHFKILQDMETNFPELIEAIKSPKELEQQYEMQYIVKFKNQTTGSTGNIFSLTSHGTGDYIVKTEHYQTDKKSLRDASFFGAALMKENEVVKIFSNNMWKFALAPHNDVESVVVSGRYSHPTTPSAQIGFTNYKGKAIEVSQFPDLTKFYSIDAVNLEMLNFALNPKMDLIHAGGCKALKKLTLNCPLLVNLYLSNCSLLTSIEYATGMQNFSVLTRVETHGSGLTKEAIITLASKWESRVGLTAGILIVSQAVYDAMTEDEKLGIINKNITIQFK